MKQNILKKIWRKLRWPLAVSALIGSYFLVLQLTGNFHTLVPGQVYRTAQVSANDVAYYREHYHIKSIINLRGENTGKKWYDAEIAASNAQNIKHFDFRMSAKRELTEEQAHTLMKMMHDAPKPLLIHCNAGADRTGLASALYLLNVEKRPAGEAAKQLWPNYGHLSLPFIPEYAMDRSFARLVPAMQP